MDEAVRPLTLVPTGLGGIVLVACLAGCVVQPPITPTNSLPLLDISGRDISRGDFLAFDGQSAVIRATVIQTEYGTPALFPMGKNGPVDAGRCIDLVAEAPLRAELKSGFGSRFTLEGRFILLPRLSQSSLAIEIGGIRHDPVCQIFADTSPYPYFLVTRIR